MLKRRVGNQIWLISQPDHAAVSGYLAAHWGNQEFAQPGYYAPAPEPERLRAEVVLAIAEHDNGWWEWEADPELSPKDGLPLHLTDLKQQHGLERWRLGVPRFAAEHPYVALLISLHADWLQAQRVEAGLDAAFHHPLFGSPGSWPEPGPVELEQARRFVAEQREMQAKLIARMKSEAEWEAAVEPAHLHPHARLLQLADALSLALCFGGDAALSLAQIPRRSWDDRVTLELSPGGSGRVVCQPYPFDTDPLPVHLRARVLDMPFEKPKDFHSWWHRTARQQIRFEYCSGV